MIKVIGTSWALLLGMALLMIGNGMQGTLLGIRGSIEGFSTLEISVVMSAYFVGFLGGSRLTPDMIRRVGHVRVFAALGSLISAALILYPTIAEPWAWVLLRVIVGFAFCGVYVTAESWLNNSTTNEFRGQALSAYMIVQMVGILAGQALLTTGDPSGFVLFVIPSVLVSLSFAPILLSVTPTPPFERTKPMNLRGLYAVSPLGCVGMFLMGGVFSAQFGMASVYAVQAGLNVSQIAMFVGTIFLGGMLLQWPIGWLSDRMDRRRLIMLGALVGAVASIVGIVAGDTFVVLLAVAFCLGGTANPLYALLIAYTNDYLEYEDMAAASGGLLFINGLGAIVGPLAIAAMMEAIGPAGFWVFVAALLLALAGYAIWRMTQRGYEPVGDIAEYVGVLPVTSPVAMGVVSEVASGPSQETAKAGPATVTQAGTDGRAPGQDIA